jgi:peptidoglycan/xylan/chitin deacetylase (PgdA/CDA1 family)
MLVAIPAFVVGACAKGGSKAANGARALVSSSTAPHPTTSLAPSRAMPAFVRRGPSTVKAVALTFHGSGDVGLLRELLAIAADRHAALTIFAVGQWLDLNPSVAHTILAGGHELANHTYTHPALGRAAPAAARAEIVKCRDALARHAGSGGRWFRPSGIEVPTPTILQAAAAGGYGTCVGYDLDPHDYQDPGAAAVRTRVAAGLHPGAIVSLHTGHRGTVDALPAILDSLDSHALRPVTVTQLLT